MYKQVSQKHSLPATPTPPHFAFCLYLGSHTHHSFGNNIMYLMYIFIQLLKLHKYFNQDSFFGTVASKPLILQNCHVAIKYS